MEILQLENLLKNYDGVTAINRISLSVTAGERRAIIGPNGAGKTTLLNLISGELAPSDGRVFWTERDITRWPPDRRARRGIARTFQRNNLFPGLSVWENVRLAGYPDKSMGLPSFRPPEFADSDLIVTSLERVDLTRRRDMRARDLSYGEQRQLEVAIALATQPKILLLDEPTAGMSPAETNRLMSILVEMPREITLLIVEHDMDMVFGLAERVTVLHYGQVIADGTTEQVRSNPRVREVYLGTDASWKAGVS